MFNPKRERFFKRLTNSILRHLCLFICVGKNLLVVKNLQAMFIKMTFISGNNFEPLLTAQSRSSLYQNFNSKK